MVAAAEQERGRVSQQQIMPSMRFHHPGQQVQLQQQQQQQQQQQPPSSLSPEDINWLNFAFSDEALMTDGDLKSSTSQSPTHQPQLTNNNLIMNQEKNMLPRDRFAPVSTSTEPLLPPLLLPVSPVLATSFISTGGAAATMMMINSNENDQFDEQAAPATTSKETTQSSLKRPRAARLKKVVSASSISSANTSSSTGSGNDSPRGGKRRKRASAAEFESGRWKKHEIYVLLRIAHDFMDRDLRTIGEIALFCGIHRPSRAIDKQLKRVLQYERWVSRDPESLKIQIGTLLSSGKYGTLTSEQEGTLNMAQNIWGAGGKKNVIL